MLSRQFLPYHFLSLAITHLYNQEFIVLTSFSYHPNSSLITLKSFFQNSKITHPFEFIVWWRHSLSRAITPDPALSLVILSYHPSYNQDFFRTLKSPHPFEFIVWWRHSLSRAITPIPALSLFILSYYPSYNQDFFRTLKSPTHLNLSFDDVIPYPVLSRQFLPYHFLSLPITHLITKIFS